VTSSNIPLGNAVELINGDRGKNYPDRDAQHSSGYCLFLSTKNVRQGYFDFSEVAFINEQRHAKLGGGTLERNDIVLTIRGTLGNTAIYRDDVPYEVVRINSAMLALRPNQYFEPDFIEGFLRSRNFMDWVGVNQRGSAQPHLRTADIETAQLPLVSRKQQRRIVAKINSLSAKSGRSRERLSRIPRLVEKYKQAILAAAFRGDLTREWRASVRRTTNWEDSSIGGALTDIRYGTAKKCSYDGGAVGVLRIPNVQHGRITLDDIKSADFNDSELEALQLQEGDILVIRSNGSLDLVGRSAVVHVPAVGMLFAGYLIRLRLDRELADPQFIQLYLQTAEVRARLERFAKSTSGVNNINSTQLRTLPLVRPNVDEQQEIVHRVETAFAWINRLASEATSARKLIDHLDQAVLAKAFRGELVPQDPTDEPASVLLERIRAERAAAPSRVKRGTARAMKRHSRTK
jgi:type I restriction enzyme S subunit